MTDPVSSRQVCECCKKQKCSKTIRVPIGQGNRTRIVKVCGRCLVVDTRQLRAWLDAEERKLLHGQPPTQPGPPT